MDVAVRLRDPRELFEQPERSPLDEDYESWCVVPAAEYLVQVIRGHPAARLVVETPDAERARAGLERFSAARAQELDREIHSQLKRALLALIPTGAVFVATLLLSRLAESAGSDWLSSSVSEALILIGWVVLWAPIAILGTDVWILTGQRRAYRKLASVEVRPA
jgi:hypothetical protein